MPAKQSVQWACKFLYLFDICFNSQLLLIKYVLTDLFMAIPIMGNPVLWILVRSDKRKSRLKHVYFIKMLTLKYRCQNVDTKIYTPKCWHQNIDSKMLTPKYRQQNMDTKMLTPKYTHQNIYTKMLTPKYRHQNVDIKILTPKYGHQNVETKNRDHYHGWKNLGFWHQCLPTSSVKVPRHLPTVGRFLVILLFLIQTFLPK
jgi:hypothetical protein